jgi:hypothetical protein
MSSECSIIAKGFRADFVFESLSINGSADLEIGISLTDSHRLATSARALIFDSDILRLADYFEAHINLLSGNPDTQSHIFTPLELSFQLQAMEGEVREDDDGEFSLRIMVNTTDPGGESDRVYVGCEGVIDVAHARHFAAKLRDIVRRLALSS